MQNNPSISVIVPMYNVEEYIKICIDSILNQTFQDFEVIIIDDASSDNSCNICRELYRDDEKVRIIRHEKNQGIGAARNTGIRDALGKYIYFVNSDDAIIPQTLEILYKVAEQIDAEVIHTSGYYEDQNADISDIPSGFFLENIINRVDFWIKSNIFYANCTDFYKREFLTENEIEFPTDCSFYENSMFQFAALCLAKKYLVLNNSSYVKSLHKNSLSNQSNFISGIVCLSTVARHMEKVLDKLPEITSQRLLKEQFIIQALEKISDKHIRPFYDKSNVNPMLDQAAYENMLPIFGDNTTMANYLLHSSNMMYQQVNLLKRQTEQLNSRINKANRLLNLYMTENSNLKNLIDEVKHNKENIERPFEELCQSSYNYFTDLSDTISRNEYDKLMDRVFKTTIEKIRRKDKIKLAFVTYNAAMWCGDKLYHYFAENPRYDVKVFLSINLPKAKFPEIQKDFRHCIEQFKSRGINVVALDNADAQVEKQDVIIFLNPYLDVFPRALNLPALTAETLLVNIPYGFSTDNFDIILYRGSYYRVLWKHFFDTKEHLDSWEKNLPVAVHGYYSGYPRLDVLLDKNANPQYHWKMTRPDAKKIIWAPHWTINDLAIRYSTFQWNFKFFYELAKANPQTSWVVKPHPNLFHSAVETGLFPSEKAFEEYIQAWNNLPNAKFESGAYYHEIFATSDGMILDSSSFIGEYQYTHKPMIFLTRDTQQFNDVVSELMKVTYRVDGRDLNGIASLINEVFIKGNDEMYDARMEFFDKHYNYVKDNGILASEYIYKNITQELGG